MSDTKADVLIIGGGIGGLSAALAFKKVGVRAQVFEQAPELGEVGAGLSLWSNAILALDRLGVRDAIVGASSLLERSVTVTQSGKEINVGSFAEITEKMGQPSVCCHRAVLQQTLADALEPGQLSTNAKCVGIEQDAEGVTAKFEDGSTARGSILVGADGIHSVVREQLFGPSPVRYAGYYAFRGMADCRPDGLPPGTTLFALGRGTQIGLMHCGDGRVYWFTTLNGPAGSKPSLAGNKADAVTHFSSWPAPIPEVIGATDDSAVLRNDIIDRPPTWPWGEGRVTLLGDSVHPTTPNLGQGACQALEDAVVLAHRVRDRGLTPDCLREYEQLRRQRTTWIVNKSWSLGNVFQWERPWAVWFRDWLSSTWFGARQHRQVFGTAIINELPELG